MQLVVGGEENPVGSPAPRTIHNAAVMRQYHIGLDEGDAGGYVLMPGDPARCELIASHFDDARHVVSNREYTTFTGSLDGVPVSVTSHGIGSPSTAIAVEELRKVGVHTMIRVGTSGSMQPAQRIGDLVIASAAVRDEGTSRQYAPLAFPAVAHLDVVNALRDAARSAGRRHHVGVVQSKDSFYGEMEAARMPVAAELQASWEASVRAGALASEMECSALFVIGSILRIRTGGIVVLVNETPVTESMPSPLHLPLEPMIETAVGSLRRLIALDRAAALPPQPAATAS